MAHYVIAGKPDCKHFVHVIHVCNYLGHNLPNFKYKKVEIKCGDWEYWLNDINIENRWNHTSSPLVWKEVARTGGRPTLIGGISDFWEYCYDYYGLESILPEEDLQNLLEDNKQYFAEKEKKLGAYEDNNTRIITIMGLPNPVICILIPELLRVENLPLENGFILRLFDLDIDTVSVSEYIIDMMDGIQDMYTFVYLVNSFPQALDNCDLLINLNDYTQREDEETKCWYVRNLYSAHMIADNINAYAKKTLRVVFANIGSPVCFCASILAQNCTGIKLTNIIAITADWGSCALSVVSKECNVPLTDLGAPPVWGFLGTACFIDIGSIIQKSDIPGPYLRALKTSSGSTLPLGKITTELRYIHYLTRDISIWEKVENIQKTIKTQLKRLPTYSKVSATIKALQIWYSGKPSDDVISLGICSNGSFGFPAGIVVSQPAYFNGTTWVPFRDFPMQEYSKRQVENMIPSITSLLEEFDISPATVNVFMKCKENVNRSDTHTMI